MDWSFIALSASIWSGQLLQLRKSIMYGVSLKQLPDSPENEVVFSVYRFYFVGLYAEVGPSGPDSLL